MWSPDNALCVTLTANTDPPKLPVQTQKTAAIFSFATKSNCQNKDYSSLNLFLLVCDHHNVQQQYE